MPDSPSTRRDSRRPGAARFRRLVRCGACFRQFDAGELAPGERFHCLCSALLAVPASPPQEAPVVRCASCGAPRAAGAMNCASCAAPFAFGEGARNTLCPVCAARLGDDQRFCHHCGTEIAAESFAGQRTDFSCPSCKPLRALASRRIPDATTALAMLECASCAGIWLGHPTFDALQERARRRVAPESLARRGRPPAPAAPPSQIAYRPCPVCRKLMVRRNFGATSGIVVDVCGADGLWFDAAELDAILAWIRAGGLGRTAERAEEERAEKQRRAAIAKQELRPVTAEAPAEAHWLDLLAELAELVLGAVRGRR